MFTMMSKWDFCHNMYCQSAQGLIVRKLAACLVLWHYHAYSICQRHFACTWRCYCPPCSPIWKGILPSCEGNWNYNISAVAQYLQIWFNTHDCTKVIQKFDEDLPDRPHSRYCSKHLVIRCWANLRSYKTQ